MSPKLVDKGKKTREIARVALSLFSQKGYSATSVDQIAHAAGIGKGTIYEYFKTKEDIFVAAMREWMAQFEIRLRQHLADIEHPLGRLHAIAEMNVKLVDELDPATARLSVEFLQHSLLEDGVLYKKRNLMKEMHIGQRRIVIDILLDGVSSGIFRPEIARDAEKIAVNFLAYMDGISLHSAVSENYFDLGQQIHFYLDNLIRMIQTDDSDGGHEKNGHTDNV
jgi:AcrR family transcriptional regulator